MGEEEEVVVTDDDEDEAEVEAVPLEPAESEKAEEVEPIGEDRDEERTTLPHEASTITANPNSAEKSAFFILGNPFPNHHRP